MRAHPDPQRVQAWPLGFAQPDPYRLMRNTATLQAWRAHRKSAFAYAQPYLTIAIVGVVLSVATILLMLFTRRLHHMVRLEAAILLPAQLLLVVAHFRIWLYQRRHPFDPDKIAPPHDLP